MSTVADVARSALAAVDSSAGLVLCSQWVAERYKQFVRRARMRHLRTVRQLELPAPYTTGTFAITQGSANCTPNAAAIAVLPLGLADYYIRFAPGATWYVVLEYDGTTLTLTSPVTDDTATASTYELVRRYHELPGDVRWAGSFVHMRFHRELKMRTGEEVSLLYPGRALLGPPPVMVAEGPRATSGAKRVEFYPYSTEPETIHYVAWAVPPTLDYTDTIPYDVDTEMLKEGVLIDIYRWEAAKAMRTGSAEAAATFGNYARQQYTQWYGKDVPEATAAERAFDDVQVILETAGGDFRSRTFSDIRDARDQVWSQ